MIARVGTVIHWATVLWFRGWIAGGVIALAFDNGDTVSRFSEFAGGAAIFLAVGGVPALLGQALRYILTGAFVTMRGAVRTSVVLALVGLLCSAFVATQPARQQEEPWEPWAVDEIVGESPSTWANRVTGLLECRSGLLRDKRSHTPHGASVEHSSGKASISCGGDGVPWSMTKKEGGKP